MFAGRQRHKLRKMTGKVDIYLNGHLYLEGVSGTQEFLDIRVPDIRRQHKVECREHGQPYRKVKPPAVPPGVVLVLRPEDTINVMQTAEEAQSVAGQRPEDTQTLD